MSSQIVHGYCLVSDVHGIAEVKECDVARFLLPGMYSYYKANGEHTLLIAGLNFFGQAQDARARLDSIERIEKGGTV